MNFRENIIINNTQDFNIIHILQCGQIFRYTQLSPNEFLVYSKDKCCKVVQNDTNAIIYCNDYDYFYNYFDLGTDYTAIKKALMDKPLINEAVNFGYGVRILRQDPWEMLISFIISANNHIPRIKKIIQAICASLGQNMGDYYAFPTAQAMAKMTESFYKDLGAGYRADYLQCTAKMVADGFDLNEIYSLNSDQASKKLQTLKGVGAKVADCILLFGYHKQDVFPVDTWIKQVFAEKINSQCDKTTEIRKNLIQIYGDLSGYAQQYIFYYKREKDKHFG